MSEKIDKVLEVNKRQKDFYNATSPNRKNIVTKIWSGLRNNLLSNFRSQFDIKDKVYSQHKLWLGDISDKKILDLGCLRGNALSLYMAKNAKVYIGIDLSDKAIDVLNSKIAADNCKNAKAIAVDFLSEDFDDADFDVIYAYGVLHHFEDFDLLISKLNEKLAAGGQIISYDPLHTSLPIKIIRTLYRPFQSDKDWEWPFKKSTLKKIDDYFIIQDKKGVLGRSKYGIVLNFLPLKKSYKTKVISKMVEKDWNPKSWNQVYKCMHLTMLLQKKG